MSATSPSLDAILAAGLFVGAPLLALGLAVGAYRLYRRGRAPAAMIVAVNVFVSLFLASTLLGAGELYYRFLHDATDGYHVGLVSQRWRQRHYRANNIRARDNVDYQLGSTAGKRRVSFLGDSYTVGHGVADVDDRFANRLRLENPSWEVHVLAHDGMDTGQLLDELRKLLQAGYELRDVVYVYSLNGISDIVPRWRRAARRIYRERPGLVRHSFVLDTLYSRFVLSFDEDVRSYFDTLAEAYAGPIWERQAQRLGALADLVAEAGGSLSVATFPFLEQMDSATYRDIHAKLGEFWRRRGVPHVDLLDTYRGLPPQDLFVNRYDTHPNEFAHGLAFEPLRRLLSADAEPAAPRSAGAPGR